MLQIYSFRVTCCKFTRCSLQILSLQVTCCEFSRYSSLHTSCLWLVEEIARLKNYSLLTPEVSHCKRSWNLPAGNIVCLNSIKLSEETVSFYGIICFLLQKTESCSTSLCYVETCWSEHVLTLKRVGVQFGSSEDMKPFSVKISYFHQFSSNF